MYSTIVGLCACMCNMYMFQQPPERPYGFKTNTKKSGTKLGEIKIKVGGGAGGGSQLINIYWSL